VSDRFGWLSGAARSWRLDAGVAAGFAGVAVVILTASDELTAGLGITVLVAVAGTCACLVWQRRRPVPATLVAAGCIAAISLADTVGRFDAVENVGLLAIFLLCYRLGERTALRPGLVCVVLLIVALQVDTQFNPFLEIITVGPWAAGQLVRSRERLRAELAQRGRDLDVERERYAAQAVRLERARIARELHDIIAHCVSAIVIQASAAERLVTDAPARVGDAIDDIAGLCRQAQAELGRLAPLLESNPAAELAGIDDLITRARATGTRIDFRLTGTADPWPPSVAATVYRIVQETLTNARKHAAGAPVTVAIHRDDTAVDIDVTNALGTTTAIAQVAGGHGLTGMRERVTDAGGTLTAGPVTEGRWRVQVRLPIPVPAVVVP
jgi:signal transduction histidine kinase